MANENARYEVRHGTRANPGDLIRAFTPADAVSRRVGGPATAALRLWDAQTRRGIVCFFVRVA